MVTTLVKCFSKTFLIVNQNLSAMQSSSYKWDLELTFCYRARSCHVLFTSWIFKVQTYDEYDKARNFFFYIQNQSGERKISLKVNFFIALVYWTNVNKNVARALFTKQMLWALHLANNSTTNYTKVWLIIRNTLLLNCKQ